MKIADSRYHACLYFTSAALARKVERLAAAAWQPTGLAPSHGYLLLLVLDQPGVTAGAVAKQLLLAPSTITRLVEKLEAAGLLRRAYQGKATHLHPMPKAEALKPQLDAALRDFGTACAPTPDHPYPADLIAAMTAVHDDLPE